MDPNFRLSRTKLWGLTPLANNQDIFLALWQAHPYVEVKDADVSANAEPS